MIHSLAGNAVLRVLGAAALAGAAALEPRVLWHVRGEGWGTPAADATTVYFVTKHHEVVAFDIDSGRERWRADTDEPGTETLGFGAVVAGPVVAVGDYNIIAFDRATGTLRWRFAPTDGHAPGPYLGVATDGLVLTGSASGRMYAIQQETGLTRWSATVSDNRRTTVFAPQANDHVAVAAFTEFSFPNTGGLVAVDLKAGTVRWKAWFPPATDRDLATNSAGGPVLYGDVAIASSGDGQIYALDLENGAIRWSLPRVSDVPPAALLSPDRDFRPLAVSGRTLLSGSLTGVVIAVDLSTKQQRWRFHSPRSGSTVFRMTADDDSLYLPYFSGELVVLDVESGRERWRVGDWKQGFLWAPLVWKDRVFVSATGLGFYAFGRGNREP